MRATPVCNALRHVFRHCSTLDNDNVVGTPRRKVFWSLGTRGFGLDGHNSGGNTHRQLCGGTQ
jgi:hypothetical protein